jgi:hypothetical protein
MECVVLLRKEIEKKGEITDMMIATVIHVAAVEVMLSIYFNGRRFLTF